jgi:nicotinamidase-related amidase
VSLQSWGERPAFLGIDMQLAILEGCVGGRRAQVEAALRSTYGRVAALQAKARAAGAPVIHVQHEGEPGHRLDPAGPGFPLHPAVAPQPSDHLVTKRHCDSFYETGLSDLLKRLSVGTLVVGGCMTQWCIDTSCRRAVSLGYDVILVGDGHMNGGSGALTFEQVIAHHNATLDGLDAGRAVASVRSAADLLG